MRATTASLALLFTLACGGAPPAAPPAPVATAPTATPPASRPAAYAALDRPTLNRLAVRHNLPLYWAEDRDRDGEVDPDEVATLLFYPTAPLWSQGGAFTSDFADAYAKLLASAQAPEGTDADAARRKLVRRDLDDASAILVRTDLRAATAETREVVGHVLAAARAIDDLYAVQTGTAAVRGDVAPDAESQSLFRRNGSTGCKTPNVEKDPACSASPTKKREKVDVYPAAMQDDAGFCKKLEGHRDAKKLLAPFVVVREKGKELVAVPYHEAYAEPMKRVAKHLREARAALKDPSEEPFRAYLEAAAKGFENNDWQPADEAWSKMNAKNSRYYLRIGPDETYWEPCSQKAGFHASFALIDRASLAMQDRLAPHQQRMEDEIAKLAGAPYKARKVTFHLPDFIQIVVNAGDSRDPIGATIGQSLPNWGPVANEGRGRTVAMTNLYGDPDSLRVRRERASTLLTAEAMGKITDDGTAGLFATVLHEAAHNLGPSHEYEVGGKKDDAAFGGDLASMLEELKAQSGAWYLPVLLRDAGAMTQEEAERAWADSVVWSFGHVARGMWTPGGARKAYSQLAAIQLGFLMDAGVLTFDAKAPAANGKDVGAFRIDFAKIPAAATEMMKVTAGIKARGDKKAALELAKKYVEGPTVPQDVIKERVLRFAQPSFVYAIQTQ